MKYETKNILVHTRTSPENHASSGINNTCRLDAGRQLYNACLGESLERTRSSEAVQKFEEIRKLPKGKTRTSAFKDLNKEFEFTQYDFHHYASRNKARVD